ncbi:MAG: hypothetical protein LPH21_09510 [Shewanella sp.]|nr:hypothetical protein [Shewanella sp.]
MVILVISKQFVLGPGQISAQFPAGAATTRFIHCGRKKNHHLQNHSNHQQNLTLDHKKSNAYSFH